jgi:hypothetical protein
MQASSYAELAFDCLGYEYQYPSRCGGNSELINRKSQTLSNPTRQK